MNLETVFEYVRSQINSELVPGVFINPVSLYPKHPDFVEADQEFPYICMVYEGEKPEYEADVKWIQASRELSEFKIWLAIAQSELDSLSLDLIKIVKRLRDLVKSITTNQNDFRIKVSGVESEYEPSGRWALAVVTVTIGAYGD